MFFYQYVSLVKGLHVKQFPAIFFVPLFHDINSSRVSSAVPYSCLLFSICSAHPEIRLLVLIYCVCSLCLVAVDLLDCPTYELLQVSHLNLHIPLEFVLVLSILSVSC